MSNYQIEVFINDEWTEITVTPEDFIKTEVLYNKLKPADTTISFSIPPDLDLLNDLRVASDDVPIRIYKDTNPYFKGYILKTFKVIKTQKLEKVKLECVSPSYLLKRKVGYDLAYSNITVTQLLTNILTTAGVTSFTLPTINYIIPGFNVIANQGGTYHEYLESILYEYGYVFRFDESGSFVCDPLVPASLTPIATFNGLNCRNKIEQEIKREDKEKVIVQWQSVKTLTDAIVFHDTTNASGGYSCLIELAPLAYLGGEENWYANLQVEEGEILAVSSLTLDISKDSDVTVHTFSQSGNRALLSIQNENTTFNRYIRKLDIKAGTCVIKKDINLSIVTKVPGTEKVETVKTKYVFDKDVGDALANTLAWYYKYSDFTYSLSSYTNVPLGSVVTISDYGLGSVTARIIQKKIQEQTGLISYFLDAVSEFIPDTVENEFNISTPPYVVVEQNPIYELKSNVSVINTYNDDTFEPDTIYLTSKTRLGLTEAQEYEGIFRVYINDSLEYTSPLPATSLTITPSNWSTLGFTTDIKDVAKIEIKLYDSSNTIYLDSEFITCISVDTISATVAQNLPEYIGFFLDEYPTTYKIGDWFIVYGEDDTPIQRGVYRVTGASTFVRVEGTSVDDNKYILGAMSDLLSITESGDYGELSDYGDITFVSNIASNSMFTSTLRVGVNNLDSTLIENGYIKTDKIDVATLFGQNATFSGTLQSANGIFTGSIQSGPLSLNISPPSSASFTTNSKKASEFTLELYNAGITPGNYAATGTYNGTSVGSVSFTHNTTTYVEETIGTLNVYKRLYAATQYNQYWIRYQYTISEVRRKYLRSISFYNTSGTLISTVSGYIWGTTSYCAGPLVQVSGPHYDSVNSPLGWWYNPGSGYTQISTNPNVEPTWANYTATDTAGDTTTTLANGSISFTAGAYTMKITNLPGYSSSLAAGTLYVAADGSNYRLMVKG